MIETIRQAFWSRVQVSGETTCWPWTLSAGSHGYGQWWPARRGGIDGAFANNWLVHRLAWHLERGAIPPGWTIDHACRNKRCCNPAHLRLMTNEENGRLNGHSVKTECAHGHPFDEANTYVVPSSGARKCRTCTRIRHSRYQTQKKEQRA